jgi:hypothetical protein
MWIKGLEGYYFLIFPAIFLLVYSLITIDILKNIKVNSFTFVTFISLTFICWVSYLNIEIIYTIILNDGWYPCKYGASCP